MFEKWKSIPRLNKEVIVTEKIDGTNAQIHIVDFKEATMSLIDAGLNASYILAHQRDGDETGLCMLAASRSRYITPNDDNFGFATWVSHNADDLFRLGPGRHYGEWWGVGIQRGYDLAERRLSMFNPKWQDQGPDCVHTTPIIAAGTEITTLVDYAMAKLREEGSFAAPGFMDPEGVVVYHTAANQMFKTTFDFDEGKWSAGNE